MGQRSLAALSCQNSLFIAMSHSRVFKGAAHKGGVLQKKFGGLKGQAEELNMCFCQNFIVLPLKTLTHNDEQIMKSNEK